MKYLENYINYTGGICIWCLEKYNRQIRENYIIESVSGKNMDIRSLSIAVPTRDCVNSCKFCCSKISKEEERARGEFYDDKQKEESFEEEYFRKLKFVSDQGCQYAMLTGDGEVMQNPKFVEMFGRLNSKLDRPFSVELQTTGVLLNDKVLNFLKDKVGVNLISLSISDIFDKFNNAETIKIHSKLQFSLPDLCRKIKEKGITLRLSLNLIKEYNKYPIDKVFKRIYDLGADQVTFRVLWEGSIETDVSNWIKSNKADENYINLVEKYLNENGEKVAAAYSRWSINGISVVLDKDCMSETETDDVRYLILRSDAELYTKWNKKSSILNI